MHPGPFEGGVFYYRLPCEEHGHIFAIPDKVFPEDVGDGRSTLEELVWKHPRLRLQAVLFLCRFATTKNSMPPLGERVPLSVAGNHSRGTLFQDGGRFVTPALERRIYEMARAFNGFFFDRFDVRYTDPEQFHNGLGFQVHEPNGAISESTNLYDLAWPLWRAYRTVFRPWSLAFRVGAANRDRSHPPIGLREIFALLRSYYRGRTVSPLLTEVFDEDPRDRRQHADPD